MSTVKPETGRRSRIAELMSLGLGSREIAERLNMTPSAVTGQIAAIRKDLGWQAQ